MTPQKVPRLLRCDVVVIGFCCLCHQYFLWLSCACVMCVISMSSGCHRFVLCVISMSCGCHQYELWLS